MRLLIVAALLTSSVRAFANDTPETGSYRMQTLAVDGITAGLFIGSVESHDSILSNHLLELGIAGLLVGAPTVHLLHGRWKSAGATVALRITLPLVGAWIGGQIGPTREQCGDCSAQDQHAAEGAGLGVLAAMALDTWLLAGDDDARTPAIVPSVRATNNGVSLGFSGRF
jgi:hypothetical protein